MLVLFTDFGLSGPYIGQMRAVLQREAPGVPVIDLFADAPTFDSMASAYLLAAFAPEFQAGEVFLCVVDPGVGSARGALILEADGRWFVGPDNGLLEIVARHANTRRWWSITWRPEHLSASFHGRDLFAPVAARLARGEAPPGDACDGPAGPGRDWPDDLARVIYIDGFGNAMIGMRAMMLAPTDLLEVGSKRLARAVTFSDVPPGTGFWYENANGLAEIAVNQGRAEAVLGITIGTPVIIRDGPPA